MAAQAEMKEELSNPVYNRQSTSIDKKKVSIRFGDNFFNSIQTTFMPINEPNMDASYILDFGDAITLQLVGQQQSIDELQIQRDGSINLPNLGKVQLSGLSLEEASKLIKAKISLLILALMHLLPSQMLEIFKFLSEMQNNLEFILLMAILPFFKPLL